jgi:hypothetical protein
MNRWRGLSARLDARGGAFGSRAVERVQKGQLRRPLLAMIPARGPGEGHQEIHDTAKHPGVPQDDPAGDAGGAAHGCGDRRVVEGGAVTWIATLARQSAPEKGGAPVRRDKI